MHSFFESHLYHIWLKTDSYYYIIIQGVKQGDHQCFEKYYCR